MTDPVVERQAMDVISRYYQLGRGMPSPDKLASKFMVSNEEAQNWINIFSKGAPEIKIAKKEDPVVVRKETPVKEKLGSKIKKFLDGLLDSGALWFAVVIDLVLNGIGFWLIGPDPVMKIGMVCISFIVVLFSVRAWMKRDKLLWAMFALVASFMDTSFLLLATDVQSENLGVDAELARLDGEIKKASDYLEKLQALQIEKGQGYAQQVRDQTATVQKAKDDRQAYVDRPKIETGTKMSAKRVATAIPDAVMSGKWDRWIFLALFVTVFMGLQLTIISATGVKWNEGATT